MGTVDSGHYVYVSCDDDGEPDTVYDDDKINKYEGKLASRFNIYKYCVLILYRRIN